MSQPSAKVVVQGSLASNAGNYWGSEALLYNANSGNGMPALGTIPIYAGLKNGGAGGGDIATQTSFNAFIGPLIETPTYDQAGNLTSDGRWNYTWNSENQLTQIETNVAAQLAGLLDTRISFAYDYLGRRIQKQVYVNGTQMSWTKYVYSGFNVMAELDGNGNVLRHFIWGPGKDGAVGGAGGLVMIQDSGHTYMPAFDGNGNVAALVDASNNGAIAATYEYSPFGELLQKSGAYAISNPIRWSSKWADDETGLVYYGLRYYNPSIGRFISQDPIGEAGGLNLYGFCGNDGVNGTDYLGMSDLAAQYMQNAGIDPNGNLDPALVEANAAVRAFYESTYGSYNSGMGMGAGGFMGSFFNEMPGQMEYYSDSYFEGIVRDAHQLDASNDNRVSNKATANGVTIISKEKNPDGSITYHTNVGTFTVAVAQPPGLGLLSTLLSPISDAFNGQPPLGTVNIGDVRSLGIVCDPGITDTDSSGLAASVPGFWDNKTPEQIEAAYGSVWDRQHAQGPDNWSAILNASRKAFGNPVFQKPLKSLAMSGFYGAALVGTAYAGGAGVLTIYNNVVYSQTAVRVAAIVASATTGYSTQDPNVALEAQQFCSALQRGAINVVGPRLDQMASFVVKVVKK